MIDHDVLIIGAGLAGMRAALSAVENGVDVAIVTKVYPVRSHSNAAQGGINAALEHLGDDWHDHAYDTVKGSDFLGDQDAITIMCQEAGDEVVAMEHMGVIFSRDEEGRLGTRNFGGQAKARTFFVADFTGQALLHVLYEQVLKANVNIYDEWFLLSLLVEDGQCCGAVVMEISSGEIHVIRAKAVIMASGGLGRVFEPSTNAMICTGDGMGAAYQAGASLMDMEMVQYHPTTLKGSGVLITEGARGDGAYLLNSEGERFMKTYAPNMMELASRDVVSRSEFQEIAAGRGIDGCVLLDMRHLGETFINERLSQIREIGKDFANVDVVYEPIPIQPGMHYQMGGIKTDVNGLTQLPGLYAAGEAACVSVHGGNRLGANSLLDTLIFGRRSGQHASDAVKGKSQKNIGDSSADADRGRIQKLLSNDSSNDLFGKVRKDMGEAMNTHFAVYRDQADMEEGLAKIRDVKKRVTGVYVPDKGKTYNTNLMFSLELEMMVECAEAVAVSALERPESRGAHTRSDFPDRDDENWLKHILVKDSEEGPQISHMDVVITDWTPVERTY
jgi:succinate dehydrogenase / fumarate reductase flavoprotein subunit